MSDNIAFSSLSKLKEDYMKKVKDLKEQIICDVIDKTKCIISEQIEKQI